MTLTVILALAFYALLAAIGGFIGGGTVMFVFKLWRDKG